MEIEANLGCVMCVSVCVRMHAHTLFCSELKRKKVYLVEWTEIKAKNKKTSLKNSTLEFLCPILSHPYWICSRVGCNIKVEHQYPSICIFKFDTIKFYWGRKECLMKSICQKSCRSFLFRSSSCLIWIPEVIKFVSERIKLPSMHLHIFF